MAVIFNNQAIIPSPLVTIVKSYNTRGDGTPISTTYDITLEGTLLPNRGSPDSTGVFTAVGGSPTDEPSINTIDEKFNAIRRKQEALRTLFSNDYDAAKTLEWYPDGGSSTSCRPIVQSINFTPGTWVERSDYAIRLSANRLLHAGIALQDDFSDLGEYNLVSAGDQWSLREEEDDVGDWTITHTISATAHRHFGSQEGGTPEFGDDSDLGDAYLAAKAWVQGRITNTIPTSIFDFSGYSTTNRNRQENYDKEAGTYTLTDTFRISNDADKVTHLYTIRHETEAGRLDGHRGLGTRNKYTATGTIQGHYDHYAGEASNKKFERANNFFKNKILRISAGFSIFDFIEEALAWDALPASEKPSINKVPIATVVTRDTIRGTVGYTLTFDDATTNFAGISNNLFSRYDIRTQDDSFASPTWGTDNLGITSLAIIPIPGRADGPIIQNLGTRPVMTRTINGTCYLNKKIGGYTFWDKPTQNLQKMKDDFFKILSNEKYNIFDNDFNTYITSFQHSFDNKIGSYTASVTYTITPT